MPKGSTWGVETTIDSDLFNKIGQGSKIHHFSSNSSQEVTLVEIEWNELKKYIVNNDLAVDINVKINEPIFKKEKLRLFDESVKEFSDVVLIMDDEKFYVSKKFLALHCNYFKTIFNGKFEEADQSEVEIGAVKSYEFQDFLELINGESFVTDYTVDGLLHSADYFDSKTAKKRCVEFLTNRSKKSLKEKIGIAFKYHIDELKENCISQMKSLEDVHSILPEVSSHVGDSVWKQLLMKTLSLTK